jgi:hypothetical protein
MFVKEALEFVMQPPANPARQGAHVPLHELAVDQLVILPVWHGQKVFRSIGLFRNCAHRLALQAEITTALPASSRSPVLDYTMEASLGAWSFLGNELAYREVDQIVRAGTSAIGPGFRVVPWVAGPAGGIGGIRPRTLAKWR